MRGRGAGGTSAGPATQAVNRSKDATRKLDSGLLIEHHIKIIVVFRPNQVDSVIELDTVNGKCLKPDP